jgi:hypothetical protein
MDALSVRMKNMPMGGLTEKGLNFLKCAFAPPDFSFSGDAGIPDGNPTRRVLYKHRLTTPVTFAPAQDVYIILAPVPGYAYFTTTVTAGAPITAGQRFNGVPYADYASIFGPIGNEANIVDKARYVSNCIEFVPTANEMTWSGNVQCWKTSIVPVLRRDPSSLVTSTQWSISGLQSCNATNADMYQQQYTSGVYAMSTKSSTDFTYAPIIENQNAYPIAITANDFGQFYGSPTDVQGIPAVVMDQESVIIKISGVTATETGWIRTWACMEYSPVTNSVLYNTSNATPCHDRVALDLYDELAKMLPVGVPYKDNGEFWQRVLAIIETLTSAGSYLPGQFGIASQGANMLTKAVKSLTA